MPQPTATDPTNVASGVDSRKRRNQSSNECREPNDQRQDHNHSIINRSAPGTDQTEEPSANWTTLASLGSVTPKRFPATTNPWLQTHFENLWTVQIGETVNFPGSTAAGQRMKPTGKDSDEADLDLSTHGIHHLPAQA